MRQALIVGYRGASQMGFDPLRLVRSFRGIPRYVQDYRTIRRQLTAGTGSFRLGYPLPCLADRFEPNGTASGHYFHQDLFVAQQVFNRNPERHVDVGSRIDGFVAHVAAFRQIEAIDIRKQESKTSGILFVQADMMGSLPEQLLGYCDSLSCLHALEHFGLGRYGDSIDVEGHLRGLSNLALILRPGGRLYLSVPIGPQRIEFNGQRVFAVSHLFDLIRKDFEVEQFSFVDDQGDLHQRVQLDDSLIQSNYGCHFGCGIVEAVRRTPNSDQPAPHKEAALSA
jgi:SAM-dependent methyltransferase